MSEPGVQRTKLDLNLLVALNALLRERSVSKAADKIGIRQPAMSAALGRLRRYFRDPILVRVGNTYRLSPLATMLADSTTAALSAVDRVLQAELHTEIESSNREFTVIMSDYILATVGDIIARDIIERAPKMRLNFIQLRPDMISRASDELRVADALITPKGFAYDLPSVDLFVDPWTCVVAKENTAVADEITLDQLSQLPWAVFQTSPTQATAPIQQLRLHGVEPEIQVVGENYLALPYFLTGTKRVSFMPERLAMKIGDALGLRQVRPPLHLAPMHHALWWHPMHQDEPEHRWFRARVTESVRQATSRP
jgi:DNA-binding transcriptional LysR family regulator